MHTENTIVDNSGYRQRVEACSKVTPGLHIVPSLTLVIKTIHSIDRLALVIAPKHKKIIRESYFVRH